MWGWPMLALAINFMAPPTPSGGQEVSEHHRPLAITLPPALDAVLRAYEEAWGRRDARALADLFTEDGFVLRPNHPLVKGREAIRRAYANSGGPLVLRAFGYATADTVGYIVGGFARSTDDPDVGKFVLTIRKGPSGIWLIAADIDNGNS